MRRKTNSIIISVERIDWQQGGTQGGAAGGKQNPTIWLNHLRCTDHVRRGENQRGVVLARWGGLGNHRYQVGFSGDVAALTWANMAFQPYFSMTGTNVGYGFWSHDIIGPSDDHELRKNEKKKKKVSYIFSFLEIDTRWVQIGAFSGIFRTHDRGMAGGGCADSKSIFNFHSKKKKVLILSQKNKLIHLVVLLLNFGNFLMSILKPVAKPLLNEKDWCLTCILLHAKPSTQDCL